MRRARRLSMKTTFAFSNVELCAILNIWQKLSLNVYPEPLFDIRSPAPKLVRKSIQFFLLGSISYIE